MIGGKVDPVEWKQDTTLYTDAGLSNVNLGVNNVITAQAASLTWIIAEDR